MRWTAYSLLTITMLLWGGNAVGGRMAVGEISPMLLNTLRWVIAGSVMVFLARTRLAEDWPVLRRNALLLVFLGSAGMTGFGIALYAALLYTTAINASIVQASMPLVVFLANLAIFRMPIAGAQWLGFAVSVAGVAVTVTHGEIGRIAELDVNVGDAIMLIGVTLYGLYTVMLRFRPKLHWQTFMVSLFVTGFATSLPFAIGEYMAGATIWPTPKGWAIAAFAGLLPSLLAQIFFVRGVEMIGANRSGLFINFVPIFGTLLSIAILGETFHTYHAVALAMVLGGIALAERRAI